MALTRHVAIVTGANHGIGAATARVLSEQGTSVLVAFWGAPEPTMEHAVKADLRDPSSAARLFDAAEAAFGPVDILVNNAPAGGRDSFNAAATDRFGRALDAVTADSASGPLEVDARGSALLIAEFARRHLARGATWGRIVGLTSSGRLGFPEEVSYGAGKAALESYALSAALELAEYGVTSNVVHPPITDTGWVTDEVREFVKRSREHFHVAAPEDVAEVIGYLCSDAARLITANVIVLR